ncbi:hypothetical protein ACFQDG_05755 [Natronoarchaeum mannanilyticum]|uniref:hypothetical protein n=1 Tax=Natronoarchaeum mannanilyticum TaxID=926360 RepID=UPI0031CF9A65
MTSSHTPSHEDGAESAKYRPQLDSRPAGTARAATLSARRSTGRAKVWLSPLIAAGDLPAQFNILRSYIYFQ